VEFFCVVGNQQQTRLPAVVPSAMITNVGLFGVVLMAPVGEKIPVPHDDLQAHWVVGQKFTGSFVDESRVVGFTSWNKTIVSDSSRCDDLFVLV